ncbi:MAG: NAD(P)H-dependent flavin oxidoreductase [Flavobacteriales bacterium]
MKTRITQVLGVEFPIIQGGMIWCSGWKLASAVSEAGGLGLIGSGSMYPEVLEGHIKQCTAATNKPFGVNLPLLYPQIADHIDIILRHQVPVVFTSAGNPKTYASVFREHGIKVVHLVSSSKFAVKAQEAGCCAVVAEGFEAGGHNGREETTTMCLIPAVTQATSIPVIAAGGIYNGKSMAAAFALGAEGVQMGSRFIATPEASAHEAFKEAILKAGEGETYLTLKELTPVRLLRNPFFQAVMEAYARGASKEELAELLGRGRAKQGMFLGNMEEGELEVGQVSALIKSIQPAGEIVREVMAEFLNTCSSLGERAIN